LVRNILIIGIIILVFFSMRIIFEKKSKLFKNEFRKTATHMGIKFVVYVLMFLAFVDLSFKYSWGCNAFGESTFPCCLIKSNK
jgi:polyferredoxin